MTRQVRRNKMVFQREEWLRLTSEVPLEPDLPICDPHHHLWDYPDSFPESRVRETARPVRHYLLEHLLKDIAGGHNIVQTVFIQCSSMYKKDGPQELRPVGETEFVQGIAAQSASGQYGNTAVAAGIIGFADLTLGSSVAPVLEAHIAASRNRFRGIRFNTRWDASPALESLANTPNLLSDNKFREGIAQLHKYNLSFEDSLYFHQLPGLVDLARIFPETPIILNHIGVPLGVGPYAGKREQVFQEWKQGIATLATCPNVVVKLGGMGMPRTGFGWHDMPKPPGSGTLAKDMVPYFMWCIEKFGTKRCMFESNFPVDRISYSYTVIWNAFKIIAKDFSPTERADLFHDTAARVYRLAM
jgi:predicted TIM-barrel fold metal-dependent hydrolase